MKPLLILPIFAAMTVQSPAAPQAEPAAGSAALASNHLAFDLLSRTAAGSATDTAFSPFSIWMALTLTSAGADGKTLEEMRKMLDLPGDDSIHAAAGEWSARLRKLKDVDMNVANRLWVQSGLKLLPAFSGIASKDYDSGVAMTDFWHETPAAVNAINQWIAQQTHDRIKDLLHAGDLTAQTRLVVTNAVYFKAKWLSPFEAEDTHKRTFHRETGGEIQADMMSATRNVLYAENDWAQAVRLPYVGGETSMIVILPHQGTKISEAVAKLGPDSFANLMKSLASTKTFLLLPRFQSEARMELSQVLGALGMKSAFSSEADFSKITHDEPLAISTVIHQAFVRVAEEGTEAAAATAVGIKALAMRPPTVKPKEFIADHPFLYFIMDDTTGGILFAGAVMAPAWKS